MGEPEHEPPMQRGAREETLLVAPCVAPLVQTRDKSGQCCFGGIGRSFFLVCNKKGLQPQSKRFDLSCCSKRLGWWQAGGDLPVC